MLPENEHQPRRPLSNWTRAAFLFAGILLPVICFLLATTAFNFSGEWQSGNLNDLVCYLLRPPAAVPFFPFLLYPMTCLAMLLLDEHRARHFAVRLGIYTALLPAIQYGFLLLITIGDVARLNVFFVIGVCFFGAIAIAAGLALYVICRWGLPWLWQLARRIDWNVVRQWALTPKWLAFIAVTAVLLIGLGFLAGEDLAELFAGSIGLAVFGSLAAAPFWALATYGLMSVRIHLARPRSRQFTLRQVLVIITWLAAYLAAWRWGIRLALAEYAKLPTEAPSRCYVCTAASRGHGSWVGSRSIQFDGRVWLANDQMCRLKAAEVVLRAAWPGLHRWLRSIYDYVGPPLAARIAHPVSADLAYTLLKIPEWLSCAVLTLAIPDFVRLTSGLYGCATTADGCKCEGEMR